MQIMRNKLWVLLALVIFITGCVPRKPQLQTPISPERNYPQKVAIILPLHGNLAGNGKATLNGFLTAYYEYLKHDPLNLTVDIVDTSKDNVKTLYKQAINNGAIFVIGPLTKRNVQSIANMGSLSVPTLALNTLDNYTDINVDNLFQFGLSSQDELRQIAAKAWAKHPGRAILIAPANTWGQNAAKFLQSSWEAYGGTIANSIIYRNISNINKQIRQTLNIDISQENEKNLERILHQKLKFTPRRRQDINVIFLIAPPNQARQIRPLLSFYFAGNIPTFSTSIIYSGIPRPNLDRDLNGVIFCDMPWTLEDSWTLPKTLATLHNQVVKFWPSSYRRYNRFYALGIDAFYLMLKLNTLAMDPKQGIAGATGTLYLDQYRHIYRQLDWAQMRNGAPYILS